ncbi:hypothetical protein [Streptomyces sp. NPDC050704]|uniref:hypothetical protein n=1 Tax=Streptomyces sp. NPDC050704 TaxID=3157219 RepID=UPI003446BA87
MPEEYFYRKTSFEVMFPAAGASDLYDPITRRTMAPRSVLLELFRKETPDEGEREWAHVAVYGPRRLKSGELGHEISSFHWQQTRVEGSPNRDSVDRPEWLTDGLAAHLPDGWSRSLLNLPGGAA